MQSKMADPIKKSAIVVYGSPARTRTTDMVVNSHPLYRLSYWGRDQFFITAAVFCQPENEGHEQIQLQKGPGISSVPPIWRPFVDVLRAFSLSFLWFELLIISVEQTIW